MPETQEVYIPCRIVQGGFSSERTFEIDTDDGGRIVGTAYIAYLRDSDRRKLAEDYPGFGATIEGYVRCRILESSGEQSLVEVPSADTIHIPASELVEMED